MRRCCTSRRGGALALLVTLLAGLSGAWAGAAFGAASAGADTLGDRDLHVIFLLARTTISPGLLGDTKLDDVPPRLVELGSARVFLTLYYQGARVARGEAAERTLATSVLQAAQRIKDICGVKHGGKEAAEKGRLLFEMMTARRPLRTEGETPLLRQIDPGVEGLFLKTVDSAHYFTPIDVLCHSHDPTPIEVLYADVGRPVPQIKGAGFTAEAFSTAVYVEAQPGVGVIPLYRGKALAPAVTLELTLRSCLSAGQWLLNMQEPEGDFMERYDPLMQQRFPGTDYAQRVAVASTLWGLYKLTGEQPQFLKGAEKVIARAKTVAKEATLESKLSADKYYMSKYVYVSYRRRPEALPSAALLQVMARRSTVLDEKGGDVRDKGLMVRLATFLSGMIGRNGLVYPSLREAQAGEVLTRSGDGSSEETAIALCRFYRHEQERYWLIRAQAILDGLLRVEVDRPNPRLAVALAEYYLVGNDRKYADLCLQVARRIARGQRGEGKGVPPDWVGGFPVEGAPDTLLTAESVEAMAYACAVATELKRANDDLRQNVLLGTRYLLNQQLRTADTFYIPRQDLVIGAMRDGPANLFLRLITADAAVRALIAAVQVIPTPADAPAKGG